MNTLLNTTSLGTNRTLALVRGDITFETTDAIVNAANEHLQHGGGVAAVIARRAGPDLETESAAWVREHGPVSHAAPAWTTGGDLPAKYVIHAVGPVWGTKDEDANLAAAVTGSLRVADELNLKSIALPAISTGIFGFPKERAAQVILSSIRSYFQTPSGLELIRVVLYDEPTVMAFEKAWHDHFSPKP